MTALMYHDVVAAGAEDSSGFPGRDAALYKIAPGLFAEHLRAIGPSRDVVLTFDDGGAAALTAADILESHGFTGHFFVTTNYVGARGFLDDRGIRDLDRRGHTIGSHSCSHPLRMGRCSWPRLLDEWTGSCHALEDLLGREVRTASVPGGDFAPQVAEAAARAGFTRLFTSEPIAESRHAFGLTLSGRFTIRKWTTAATAAALVNGAWLPRVRQAVAWNAKKFGKRVGGDRYLQLRRLLLGHGHDVRWGDQL